jgi:hypothetical protein
MSLSASRYSGILKLNAAHGSGDWQNIIEEKIRENITNILKYDFIELLSFLFPLFIVA